ncbi:MAG TPA: restriction endonuclease subunit S [Leptolyngbyaceae cyanobacterium]
MQTNFPEGWKLTTLGDISRVRRGASPRPIDSPEWFADEGPGWVRITDVTKSKGRLRSTEQYLSPSGALRSVPVKPGQLIMSICATIGEPAIVEIDVCIHDGFVVFDQYDKNLDTQFLYYFLRYWMPQFRAIGQTGTQANLNTNIVNATPIILPPIQEQQLIAEILNALDETIAHTTSIIAKLKQIKAGLLHDLLTRGLDENGELRDAIAHPEQFKDSPLGLIPKDWEIFKLSEVVPRAEYGISVSLEDEVGIPVLRMNNLKNGEVDLTDLKKSGSTQAEKLLLQNFDVLFNRTNSIEHVGRTGIWRGQISQASFASYLVRLVPDTSKLIHEYLNIWLNLPSTQLLIRRYATPGVHQVNINPTNLRKILIALPDTISEQKQIVEKVSVIDSRIGEEEAYLEKLKLQKKGLMHDLLTGKVRVNQVKNNLAIPVTA